MAVVIHHGPNGSFKSFGIVQRFAIPALQEGRTVVTNIKGFDSIDRICEVMGVEIPESAELLYLDTQGFQETKDHLARWFHWVPFGALLVIDECQTIYREGRGGFDPDSVTITPALNVEPVLHTKSNGETIEIERPPTLWEAFERHRHFEWDVFLCSPNIGKIHKQLRLNTEFAYRHREMTGVLPWKIKPCWREVQHDPENTGKAVSNALGKKDYNADPRIWQCYSSTETGEHRDKIAKFGLAKNGKLLGVLALCIVALLWAGANLVGYQEKRAASAPGAVSDMAETGGASVGVPADNAGRVAPRSGSVVYSPVAVRLANELSIELTRITGYSKKGRSKHYMFEADDGDGGYTVTSDELRLMGFVVTPINHCMARVSVDDYSFLVMCRRVKTEPVEEPVQPFNPMPQEMLAGN